jgi:hypothetical protein
VIVLATPAILLAPGKHTIEGFSPKPMGPLYLENNLEAPPEPGHSGLSRPQRHPPRNESCLLQTEAIGGANLAEKVKITKFY